MGFAGNSKVDSLILELEAGKKPIEKASILVELSNLFCDSAKYHEQTVQYLNEAIEILNTEKNDSLKIVALNYYGLSEFNFGNYELAASRFFEAISIAEHSNNQVQLSKLYNNLGLVFDEIEDYEQAIKYYQKSFELDSIAGDEKGVGMSYLNLAISFQNLQKLDSAFILNQKALTISEKVGDSLTMINAINNLGTVEYDRKNYEKSLAYYNNAKDLFQKTNDQYGIATVYNNLGLIYLEKKQYDKALKNLKMALEMADGMHLTDFKGDIYNSLSSYYEEVGDFKNAFKYYDLYSSIYDSLLSESKDLNIRKVEAQYNLEKKQELIAQLQKQTSDQEKIISMGKSIQLYLYIIIFLVVVILVTGYVLLQKERKLSKELAKTAEELKKTNLAKDKFFSIIAHDLKNPFNALISYTSLLKTDFDRFNKAELSQILDDLNNATERGFNLLENLLHWTRSQTKMIKVFKTDFNLFDVVEDVKNLAESNLDEKNQELKIDIDKSIYVYADKDMIATVVRNLIFNSIKFSGVRTLIQVDAEKINNNVQISVIDQGIGIAPADHTRIFNYEENVSTNGTAGEIGSGLGLVISREFIEKNSGFIWVESKKGEGATFKFTLPISGTTSSTE